MYTHPSLTRRGVGRRILAGCEEAASSRSARWSLVATLSGHPLYEAFGFTDVERIVITGDAVDVPAIRMRKEIQHVPASPDER